MIVYVANVHKASSSKEWSSVKGVVISSKAVRGCGKSYIPEIIYQYKVGMTSYTGNRMSFGMVDCGSESESQAIASQYPVEMIIMVHFNPEMPGDAVIMAGQVSKGTWWGIIVFPFFIFGLAFVSWSFLRHVRFT